MVESKKCDKEDCNNIIVDKNIKTKILKKYCSKECRYSDHSNKMIKHPRIEDAPVCKYHLCDNLVSKKTTGLWRIYCSRQCQNKSVAFLSSDIANVPAPKCKNNECKNLVTEGRYGHWHIYCSRKCAGKFNSLESREKSKETYKNNTGYENPSFNPTVINLIKKTKKENHIEGWSPLFDRISEESRNKLLDKNWLEKENNKKTLKEISLEIGISESSLGVRFKNFGLIPKGWSNSISLFEKEVRKFLDDNCITYETNNRDILKPKELDILIPDYNLAIECNGTYWHSELNGKDSKFHLDKTIKCKEAGINLIHISNAEWNYKNEIIKSLLLSKFGKLDKIYARSCDIKILSTEEEKIFLNKNHLQGYVASKICLGLIYNEEIVSLMSFGKSRFKKDTNELLRFANKLNTSVTGAASKLFSNFIKTHNISKITSYSHRDKFTGNLYKKLGFKFSHSTSPSYYYTSDYTKFENRLKYQKHKLEKLLPIFDPNLTEWENMKNNGYDRIWDCGNDVWEWNSIRR